MTEQEKLKASIAELETVISGYEDTINERDRENARLRALNRTMTESFDKASAECKRLMNAKLANDNEIALLGWDMFRLRNKLAYSERVSESLRLAETMNLGKQLNDHFPDVRKMVNEELKTENAVLKAQLARVVTWVGSLMWYHEAGHDGSYVVSQSKVAELGRILSSTTAPLAVVDATICGPDNDPEMMMDNFVCVDVDVERGSRVTVVVLLKGEGDE